MSDELKPCPFCGGEIKPHPSKREWAKEYKVCYHKPDCWMLNKSGNITISEPSDFTLIPLTPRYIKAWNTRHDSVRAEREKIVAEIREIAKHECNDNWACAICYIADRINES